MIMYRECEENGKDCSVCVFGCFVCSYNIITEESK